jgi:hypothetical protein
MCQPVLGSLPSPAGRDAAGNSGRRVWERAMAWPPLRAGVRSSAVTRRQCVVRLHDRQFIDEHETYLRRRPPRDGPTLHPRDLIVAVWTPSKPSPDFREGLAAAFRGLSDERSWSTNHLRLTAVVHSAVTSSCSGLFALDRMASVMGGIHRHLG